MRIQSHLWVAVVAASLVRMVRVAFDWSETCLRCTPCLPMTWPTYCTAVRGVRMEGMCTQAHEHLGFQVQLERHTSALRWRMV